MSRLLGKSLPDEVVMRLWGDVLPPRENQAILLITIDEAGRPHVAMISYFELVALAHSQLRLAVGSGTRTERNLKQRHTATLVLIDSSCAYYIKSTTTDATDLAGFPSLKAFHLDVDEVLLDEERAEEGGAQLTGGITFRCSEESLKWRQDLRRALLASALPPTS